MTCRRKPPLSFVGWAVITADHRFISLHAKRLEAETSVGVLYGDDYAIEARISEIRRATPPKKKK